MWEGLILHVWKVLDSYRVWILICGFISNYQITKEIQEKIVNYLQQKRARICMSDWDFMQSIFADRSCYFYDFEWHHKAVTNTLFLTINKWLHWETLPA